MYQFLGRCHCGNIEVTYRTTVPPEAAAVRACQCSFCRKHAARAISDPEGSMEIVIHRPEHLRRYRFGLEATDFLICGTCGVYLSAYMADGEAAYANVMVNVLDDHERYTQLPTPADYDNEDEAARRQRRRLNWTPATLLLVDA
jgi:hypothetical protein